MMSLYSFRNSILIFAMLTVAACDDDASGGASDAGSDAGTDAGTDTDTDSDTDSDCVSDKWVNVYSSVYYYESPLTGMWVGLEDGALFGFNEHRIERIDPDDDSWDNTVTTCTEGLLDISGPSEEDQYRSFVDGTLLKYSGGTFATLRDLDNFEDVWIADDGTGFLIEDGSLLRFDGATLTPVEIGLSTFDSVFGLGPNDVYAASCDGLYHFEGSALSLALDPAEFLESWSGYCVEASVWVTGGGEVLYSWGSYVLKLNGAAWSSQQVYNLDIAGITGTGLDDFFIIARDYSWPPPDDKFDYDPTATERNCLAG